MKGKKSYKYYKKKSLENNWEESSHEKTNIVESALKYRLGSAYACRTSLPGQTRFAFCGFFVLRIITLYFYPPDTECVGPD